MNQNRKTAIIVGFTVLFSTFLLVVTMAILSRWQIGDKGFTIRVKYTFLNDIMINAPVKLAGGIKVGFVQDIRQEGVETIVELFLDDSMRKKIPKSPKTKISIFTTGMMGQKYINLTIPKASDLDDPEFIKPGELVRGVDPPSIDQIMLSFTSWFDGKNGGQVLAEVVKETRSFVHGLNGILTENRQDIRETVKLARLSFGKLSSQLEGLMNRLNVVSANFQEISSKNKEDIKLMLKNLSYISKDFNTITHRIQSGQGSIGKFVNNDEIYQNLNLAAKNARILFKKLKDKPHLLLYKK